MNKLYRIQLITEKGGKITKLVDKEFKVGDLVEYDNEEWKVDKYVGTITASVKNQIGYIENGILKSRQLTPLEAWLMNGYDVDTYDRVKATGISDTTMYMLAGNSIPVNVLEAIFEELLLTKYD